LPFDRLDAITLRAFTLRYRLRVILRYAAFCRLHVAVCVVPVPFTPHVYCTALPFAFHRGWTFCRAPALRAPLHRVTRSFGCWLQIDTFCRWVVVAPHHAVVAVRYEHRSVVCAFGFTFCTRYVAVTYWVLVRLSLRFCRRAVTFVALYLPFRLRLPFAFTAPSPFIAVHCVRSRTLRWLRLRVTRLAALPCRAHAFAVLVRAIVTLPRCDRSRSVVRAVTFTLARCRSVRCTTPRLRFAILYIRFDRYRSAAVDLRFVGLRVAIFPFASVAPFTLGTP